MSGSLTFDGVTGLLKLSMGNWAGTSAHTLACVIKRNEQTQFDIFMHPHDSVGSAFLCDNNGLLYHAGAVDDYPNAGPTIGTADNWVLVAFSKAAGSDVGTFDYYKWDTTTWTHYVGQTAVADMASLTALWLSRDDLPAAMNMLIAGVWDTQLSTATINTLNNGTQAWIDAAPKELWRCDKGRDIKSLAGTSAESSRTGVTLNTGAQPKGWIDLPGGDMPVLYWTRAKARRGRRFTTLVK